MIDKRKWHKPRPVLILRTIYLDPQQDEELRKIAFEHKIAKGELIRRLLDIGLHYKADLHPTAQPGHSPDNNKEDIDF